MSLIRHSLLRHSSRLAALPASSSSAFSPATAASLRGLASEPSTTTPEQLALAAAPRGAAFAGAPAHARSSSGGGGSGGADAGGGGGLGGAWQRLVSFLAGAGLAGALGYLSLLHDLEHSTRALEAALGALREAGAGAGGAGGAGGGEDGGEAGALRRETRVRLALLEHEVALLRRAAGDDLGAGPGDARRGAP